MKKTLQYFIVVILIVVFLGITLFTLYQFVFDKDNKDQTPPVSPPEPPTILTSNQTITTDRLLIQWTSVTNADNYSVYVDDIFNVSSDDNQEEVIFLTNGTYQITVTAINKSGESLHSNPITIIVAIPPISLGLVQIYVNSTIYSTILSNITQYKQDINTQGYEVNVINWSSNNVTHLKNDIILAYSNGLIGAVLIGKLPYAKARYWESWNTPATPPPGYGIYRHFSCDYYLMDLDGNWTDVNANGYYDVGVFDNHIEHNNGTADALPEIWVARISPYTISETGFNPITALSDFFNRTHNLRLGLTYRPHKALLYIDDEWAVWRDEWISNFTTYTGNNLTCESDYNAYANDFTNVTYFLSNISDITHPQFTNYELVHVMAHCNSTDQLFGIVVGVQNNPLDGILNYHQIYMNSPQPLFYNLYSCFSGNLMETNNIGTHYLFSGQTLLVIACARSGGMSLYQPFYDALRDGKIFGEAFKDWFYGPEIIPCHHWEEVYGMTIFGDPLLTVHMT